MMPWCARMKQLIEEKGVDEPPKPDFSRSLPPLLMETMDIGNPVDSNEEKFMVRLLQSVVISCCVCRIFYLAFFNSVQRFTSMSHSDARVPQRFDDTSEDEDDPPADDVAEKAAAAPAAGSV